MAGPERNAAHVVDPLADLEREPWAFDFFQAMRRLECAYPSRPRIGTAKRPADDPIRLGQEPSMAFAPSAIASYSPSSEGRSPRLSVFFLGLLGPNGPMPLHLTEYARNRTRLYGDRSLARFLDVFHHRMLGLFYRAWAQAQPAVHLDRPGTDRFSVWLGSTFGQGTASSRGRDEIPDFAKLHFAGRLAAQTRPAEGLEAMIAEFFGVGVAIEPFRGTWLDIPEEARWDLGAAGDRGVLGESISLGARAWDRQQSFRITMGPLSFSDYERLLPGGESLTRLAALVRNYSGDELDWDVNLILARDAVPPFRLGGPTRLGLTTWIMAGASQRDCADLVVRPARAR
jgi:type VI secretion system protein ImpH